MANARIIDRGWMRIKSDMAALKGQGVKVGLRAGGPSQDGVPVVQYATFNEFGTAEIPARPFMRITADNSEKPTKTFAQQLVKRLIDNQINANGVLNSLGMFYQARIRATIRSSRSWAVPNAPSTVAAKGSSTPLIDNAILIGAIDYEKTRI